MSEEIKYVNHGISSELARFGFNKQTNNEDYSRSSYLFADTDVKVNVNIRYSEIVKKYTVKINVRAYGLPVTFRVKEIEAKDSLEIYRQVNVWARNVARKIENAQDKKRKEAATFEYDSALLKAELDPLLKKYNFTIVEYEPIFGGIAQAVIVYKATTLYVQRGLQVDVKICDEKLTVPLGTACEILKTIYGNKR